MSEPFRVLIYESGSGKGGSATSLRSLLRSIDPDVAEPVVAVLPGFNRRLLGEGDFELHEIGFVNDVRFRNHRSGILRFVSFALFTVIFMLPAVAGLMRLIRKKGVSLVHGNNDVYGNLCATIAGTLTGVPVLQHIRAQRPFTRLEMFMDRYIARYVFPLQNTRDLYPVSGRKAHIYYDRIDAGAYTVDPERVAAMRKEMGLPGGPVLLYIGSIRERKGLPFLIDAVLGDDRQDYLLLVAGDVFAGEEKLRGALEEMVNSAGQAHRIRFTGFCPEPALMYGLCDIVVFPTFFNEGFGRIIVEAGLTGKAVICSDTPASRELLALTGGGTVFAKGDGPALLESVHRTLPGFSEEKAAAVRNATCECFNVSKGVEALTRIYRSAAGIR